jgi:hypothetical protein
MQVLQQIMQPFDCFFVVFSRGAGAKTARIASSNTFLRPFWVRAEHSRYLYEKKALVNDRVERGREKKKKGVFGQKGGTKTNRTAAISRAIPAACWYEIGTILRSRNFSIVSGSSLKSSFVPTKMRGMLGAW